MLDSLWGIFTFFVMLFIVMVHYWYIAAPLIVLAIWGYFKTDKAFMKRMYSIFFAFIILSVIAMSIQYFFLGNM